MRFWRYGVLGVLLGFTGVTVVMVASTLGVPWLDGLMAEPMAAARTLGPASAPPRADPTLRMGTGVRHWAVTAETPHEWIGPPRAGASQAGIVVANQGPTTNTLAYTNLTLTPTWIPDAGQVCVTNLDDPPSCRTWADVRAFLRGGR